MPRTLEQPPLQRIAHRGAKLELPENSVEAFGRAIDRGADAIELDVHATRDDVLVVHHDASIRLPGDLLRTPIVELSGAQVSSIELAPGIRIPTLADVLVSLPADRTAYVEIKGLGMAELVAPVVAGDARCVVHSFDFPTIVRMRELAPQTARGVLFEHRVPDVLAVMAETGARDVWPEWPLIDRAIVERVRGAGGRVIAWTVNDAKTAAALIGMGVEGICTDDVRLLDGLSR